jgi:hypothetical protein
MSFSLISNQNASKVLIRGCDTWSGTLRQFLLLEICLRISCLPATATEASEHSFVLCHRILRETIREASPINIFCAIQRGYFDHVFATILGRTPQNIAFEEVKSWTD